MTSSTIKASVRAYENWLEAQIGPDFVKSDLDEKHRKMRSSPFAFLRGTYWRWAEIILEVCPQFRDAPQILAVGDTHVENFGTWRDAEGRLVWGVNDFDDAMTMPYPLDIVRLAASALLARGKNDPSAREICASVLAGYARGVASPLPFVLERDHKWLRKAVLLPEKERAAFWKKFESFEPSDVPARYRQVLQSSMPRNSDSVTIAPRTAGLGSLGRPRFVARAMWNGGPMLREAKAVVVSAWSLHHAPTVTGIRAAEIAAGRFRAPDPHYRLLKDIIVRRLSPNSRKVEVKELGGGNLISPRMLEAMGCEIGNCQAGDLDRIADVRAALKQIKGPWLHESAKAAARAVTREHADFS